MNDAEHYTHATSWAIKAISITPVTGKPVDAQNSKSKKEPMKGSVISTMAGMVLAIKVKVGDVVNRDDLVATVEAMKMENDVYSPHAGIVREILAYEGELINIGDVLMVVKEDGK